MGLILHMYGLCFTTHGSNLKSPYLPGSVNCNCDIVAHSSLSMDPFAHGDTISMIFSDIYNIYYDISESHDIFYRVMNFLYHIRKKIHDMAATHDAEFVESFDVIWERVCRDVFSMIDYDSIS